ncbi:hypothetical protein [Pseudomonas aeruginosa]|uniref:hypothetical protein n=1 Tax=Pseudomonas aeruginosa TaxID=287 RepID=UPI00396A0BEB
MRTLFRFTASLYSSRRSAIPFSSAVITIGALNGDGAMDFSIEEAEIARAMIAQARQLTVIADSSKLGRRALFQVFPLSRINRLVVDRKPTGELWEALQQARVEVHEAPLRTPQA